MKDAIDLLEAHLVGEGDWIGIDALCRICGLSLDVMTELADLGVVSPRGYSPPEWQLPATSLPRLRTLSRLMHDLDLNVVGAALAVELIETQRRLEHRLRELERHLRSGG